MNSQHVSKRTRVTTIGDRVNVYEDEAPPESGNREGGGRGSQSPDKPDSGSGYSQTTSRLSGAAAHRQVVQFSASTHNIPVSSESSEACVGFALSDKSSSAFSLKEKAVSSKEKGQSADPSLDAEYKELLAVAINAKIAIQKLRCARAGPKRVHGWVCGHFDPELGHGARRSFTRYCHACAPLPGVL